MKRTCLICGLDALPGQSRCAKHLGGGSWGRYIRKNPERAAFYASAAWRSARAAQLRREPNCAECGRPATHVDHIRPRAEGGAALDPSNLQSLCETHHRAKTVQESHRGRRRASRGRHRGGGGRSKAEPTSSERTAMHIHRSSAKSPGIGAHHGGNGGPNA
jgi:5-methylcytosine-specific restriction endonuclease McrA